MPLMSTPEGKAAYEHIFMKQAWVINVIQALITNASITKRRSAMRLLDDVDV